MWCSRPMIASAVSSYHWLATFGSFPSDLVARDQLAADDHALDLARALADQQQRRVAIEPLDLVFLGVAVAAVDAEGVLDDLLARLGREQLRHPGLDVRALARV